MPNPHHKRDTFILAAAYTLLFVLLVIIIPERGHGGDLGHWERWAHFILHEGIANIYNYGLEVETLYPCNYPPVILYFFGLFGWMMGDAETITQYSYYFKVIPLIFDFMGAMLVFALIRPARRYWWLPLLLLLNPVYLYNSYFWGQMDSILTVFVLAALLLACLGRIYWATVLFALALHTKFQAVIFIPVFLLAVFPRVLSWRMLLNMMILGAAAMILPLLPFLWAGTLDQWFTVMTGLVDQYQNVSLNAYNFWQFFHEGEGALYAKDYQPFWWGLPYKTWGLSLFLVFGAVALIPLFLGSLKVRIDPPVNFADFTRLVLGSAFLCVLVFFFFNTQMHERYSHPALLLAFLYGILKRDYWLFILTGGAYFLNMEAILQFFDWDYSTFIFNKDLVAGIYLMAIIYGLYRLYRDHKLMSNFSYLSAHIFPAPNKKEDEKLNW